MIIYFLIPLYYFVKLSSGFNYDTSELVKYLKIINNSNQHSSLPNEADSLLKIIAKAGYKIEEHNVETEDGYILKMHRIPCSKISCKKTPILCVHGIYASSSSFVLRGPTDSLRYILADADYDVWLGNTRGSIYSRNHVKLSNESMKFWKFSFHEKGIYDHPAMIDYILKKTKHPKLTYIGHSEGTTNFYVLLSVRPEYNKKISIGFMLSPVVYLKYSKIPLLDVFIKFAEFIGSIYYKMGIGEFLSIRKLFIRNQKLICDTPVMQILCIFPFVLFFGFRIESFDPKAFNLYLLNAQGASIMEVLHFSQLYKTGQFKWYDYGLVENESHYNTLNPPFYNLCEVIVPTILFYSDNDLVSFRDVNKLYSNLRKSMPFITEDATISHLDFILGKTAKEMVYDPILEILHSNITNMFPTKDPNNCIK